MKYLSLNSKTGLRLFAALALSAATFSSMPGAAGTANAAPAGISLATELADSKGATLFRDRDMSTRLGSLLRAFGEERRLPVAGSTDAQIYLWSGAGYKAGRATFWRSSLQKTLQDAGYDYADFDNHEVSTNIYEQQYGLASYDDDEPQPRRTLTLATGDAFWFFSAVNKRSGQVIAGLWVDQKEAGKALLAVAPLGVKAIKTSAALPAVTGANTVLVKDINNVMKGMAAPPNPAFPKIAIKKGYARGLVKDTNGRPLQGAMITVTSSAAGGFRTSVTTKTNAQGLYEVVLPVGVCQVVDAYHRIVYNGKPYFLPLRAVDGNRETFPSTKGSIENFVLRTWGVANADGAATSPKEGAHYFGASMRVQWFYRDLPESGTVEMTLKPQGPLLGGGSGRTFVVRVPLQSGSVLSADYYINNIPIGRYSLTARILDDGDVLPLKIEKVFSNDRAVENLQVDFKNYSDSIASQDRSNIDLYQVVFKP